MHHKYHLLWSKNRLYTLIISYLMKLHFEIYPGKAYDNFKIEFQNEGESVNDGKKGS